jgi:hypothetical protein
MYLDIHRVRTIAIFGALQHTNIWKIRCDIRSQSNLIVEGEFA